MLAPEPRIPLMLVAAVIVVCSLIPVQRQVVDLGNAYIRQRGKSHE